MSRLLLELESRGALGALDTELARTLGRLSGDDRPELLLAIALASREVQEGNVCLDLCRRVETPLLGEAGEELAPWPSLADWRRSLEHSRAVQVCGRDPDDDPRPLVLDEKGRVYLARYYDHERRVAAHFAQLAGERVPGSTRTSALVDTLFQARPDGSPDLQREATLASRTRRLSVIVGGPGTGKTSTVVKLLALLAADASAEGRPPARVLLTAPTGKAAQRLSEAVEKARDKLPLDEVERSLIPSAALTIHRALGSIEGSTTRFRHGPDHPLDCDVLVVDEASMVNLALMRRLLDALPARARVILLGDPDQLASVEAGGVLADLCAAAEDAKSPLAACVSRLTESHRYRAQSGIAQLARAVHAQDAELALHVLRSGQSDVNLYPPISAPRLGRALEAEVRAHYRPLRDADLEARLHALERFRVLCAHRLGDAGVEALNLAIASSIRGRSTRAHEAYAGRPILISQNDYASNLFNGDVGVLHGERESALSACFARGDGRVRRVALGRLPAHESVYAMTVHKSQGSEFERVAIVLPARPSPVLTRELLYTAITRAKSALSVYASEASLRAAIERRTARTSGLTDRLRT